MSPLLSNFEGSSIMMGQWTYQHKDIPFSYSGIATTIVPDAFVPIGEELSAINFVTI